MVITGASAGIGRAAARAFAARGDRVALLARGEAGLRGAADDVKAAGGQPVCIPTDVADYDGIPGGKATAPCTSPTADDTAYKNSNYAVSAADKAHVVAAPGVCPYTTVAAPRYS